MTPDQNQVGHHRSALAEVSQMISIVLEEISKSSWTMVTVVSMEIVQGVQLLSATTMVQWKETRLGNVDLHGGLSRFLSWLRWESLGESYPAFAHHVAVCMNAWENFAVVVVKSIRYTFNQWWNIYQNKYLYRMQQKSCFNRSFLL